MFGKNRLEFVLSHVDLVNIGIRKIINEQVKFEVEKLMQTY